MYNCPFILRDNHGECPDYVKPIDNSRFFGHFLSFKGRINGVQFLVRVLIAFTLFFVLNYAASAIFSLVSGTGAPKGYLEEAIQAVSVILPFFIILCATRKRCQDTGSLDIMHNWLLGIIFIYLLLVPEINSSLLIGILSTALVMELLYLTLRKGEDKVTIHGTIPLKPYEEQVRCASGASRSEE